MRDLVDELLQAKVKTKLFGGQAAPTLGRLQLIDRIGAGAMGTVFAAYDPKLERKVAIKVLHSADAKQRVLAEARALAKLAHPNVVAIYDADELDGLVYIVMELAAGVPLRTWAGQRRDWRDVVRVMREAATGIAAAHDSGLVHRDIKPDNILIGDDRARVVDFGLALSDDDGNSAGTPSYMAPEALAGEPVTAASDQFSFGVTLFEALYGTRPHGGADASATTAPARSGDTAPTAPDTAPTRATLRALALAASSAAPNDRDVPPWVHAVVARTLAADAGRRFPDMSAVVNALSRDRRRMTLAVAVAIGALVVGAGLGAFVMHGRGGDPCNDAGKHRAAVWNESMRTGVRSGLAGAPWTARTIAALDDASAHWETSYKAVCEATRVHGSQSDALLELRMRCLDRVLDRFGALATALAGPLDAKANPDAPAGPAGHALDASARAAAPSAVAELPRADACATISDPNELTLPADPTQRDRAVTADRELARGWAAFSLGRYREAREIATNVEIRLAGIEAPAIRAAALVLGAAVEARIGEPASAHRKLAAALDASAAARSGALELEVWARLLRSELFAGDPAHVIEWAPFARAAAARAGRKGAEIDGIVAEALRDSGRFQDAKELLDRALASDDPLRVDQRAVLELNLGSIELATGDSGSATITFQRARDRMITAFGDRHPDLALYADKLADAARARGKIRDAMRLHEQSSQLRTAAFGDDDRSVATSLLHRAQTELEAGELGHADRDLDRAKAIRARVFGEASPRLGEIVAALGDVALARGEPEAARGLHDRAVALDARLGRPTHPAPVPYRAGLDPSIILSIAHARVASGAPAGTADLFASALAATGNEPTRTALDAALGLAQADDPRATQAARTAVALYQAMPELGRGATYELALKLARL